MPKKQAVDKARVKLDRYLEANGLLNYQTAGMSQSDIAARYSRAGVRVNDRWFSQNYGGSPGGGYGGGGQSYYPNTPTMPTGVKGPGNRDLVKVGQYSTHLDRRGGIGIRDEFRGAPTTALGPTPFATVQDALNGTANWSDVDVQQRKSILADPKFYDNNQLTKYPTWMQQQILADPDFDWTKLPKWQKWYYELSSRPALMGAAQGLILGMGNPGGAVFGGVLGGVAAKTGYDPALEFWEQGDKKWTWDKNQAVESLRSGFGMLNFLAEQAEKTIGVGVQIGAILTGNDPDFDPTKRNLDIGLNKDFSLIPGENFNPELLSGSTWDAGAITFETLAPAYKAVVQGNGATLDDILKVAPPIWVASRITALMLHPEQYKGEELVLGAKDPLQLESTFYERINEAQTRIKNGEDYRKVALEFQNGVIAQLGDMAGQGIADPLNYTSKATNFASENVAQLTGHKVAAESFAQTSGPIEAGRMYKTLVQTGQAKVIDPKFRVDQMGAFSRFIAQINEQGQIKAGSFTQQGLLSKTRPHRNLAGWLENMSNLTPESRAQVGAGMFYENIGALLTMFDDPRDAGKYLRALANNDMETWAQLGTQFAGSPEFYTVLPALKDFNTSILDGIMQQWDGTENNRSTLLKLADILAIEPSKMIDELADGGTKEQDFVRIVEKLRNSKSPSAKVMLDEIQTGRFTADSLADIVKVFTGDGAAPWHPGQWKAMMLNSLGEHFDSWVTNHFDLKPDSGFFRVAHLMKSAQSVLLLGGSPGYAITNGLSNMVHRAATGIFGYLSPSQIDGWLDRFGVKPARLEEGYGIGAMVDQVETKTGVVTEAQRAAKRKAGPLQTAHDAVNKLARGMPFNKLSSWFEKNEGRNGFVIAMRSFWSRSWRRGVGFSKMSPELVKMIQESGGDPNQVYSAIEAGLNQADIEKALFSRQQGVTARSLVHDAAQEIGISASDAAAMLDKVGVLDALDGYMNGTTSPDRLNLAFKRAMQRAQDEIDIAASRDLIARAEHVSQRVTIEGAKGLTDVITDVEMMGIEKWMQHYERMGEAANAMDIADPAARSNIWDLKYNESNQEFRRFNALRGTTYLGILKAVGLDENVNSRAWLTTLADIDRIMDGTYQYMREQRNAHFDKWRDNWDDPRQFEERGTVEKRIDQAFKKAMQQEQQNMQRMSDLLGKQYEQLFGADAGEAARQAWDKITRFRKEMVDRQQDFRSTQKEARDQGVPYADRAAAAREFWQKTYTFMIVEMGKIKQDAIAELDRITRNGGTSETPAAPPSPEIPPGTAVLAGTDPAALRQAQATRQAEQRAKMAAIWEIAESFSKEDASYGGNYSRSNFNDRFPLLGALKKEEYGGDPTISSFDDIALKLEPDQVREILEKRKAMKEAERASLESAREQRFTEVREQAAKRQAERKAPENITILSAIRKHGGIDWSAVIDITGERTAKGWQPGIFSKTGKKRWGLDQMAQILADDGYPINLNDPADLGGIKQLTDLMQRAQRGEQIFPVTHDFEIEAAALEADVIARLEEEIGTVAEAAEASDYQSVVDTWEADVQKAINAGDMTRLAELFPSDLSDQTRSNGETYAEYWSRAWDETEARTKIDAEALKIAENVTRSQLAMEEMNAAAEIAMTRQTLIEKYAEAFPKVSKDQIHDWMDVSDAALTNLGKLLGLSKDEMYTYYHDVIRGTDPTDLMQIQPVHRRMTTTEIENYARALVRAGDEGELRRAIQGEPHLADRRSLINAAHKLNPTMAESVAGKVREYLFQDASASMRGGVQFFNGRAIIHAWEGGDISTIAHENAHIFLNMMRDAGRRTGNLKLLDDLATFDSWAQLEQSGNVWTAINGNGQHTITQRGEYYIYRGPSGQGREFVSFDDARYVLEQEMFARGFERYLADGSAPTPRLKAIFSRFKTWLVGIYSAITGSYIDVNLTGDMRRVFDRLLEEQRTVDEIMGSGDQRQPAYKQLRDIWPTMDEIQQTEAISIILNKTLVDPLSGLESLVAKSISEKPSGWIEGVTDLNALTAINNTWGHGAGDYLITGIGKIAGEEVAKVGGRAFRVGGDEFSYWFPDDVAAQTALSAIDLRVQDQVFDVGGARRRGFSISYGYGETLKLADEFLYKDKAKRVESGLRSTVRDAMPASVKVIDETASTEAAMITSPETAVLHADDIVPTEAAVRSIVPFDDWESSLLKTRDYARQLIEAGRMIGKEAQRAWRDHAALIDLVKRTEQSLDVMKIISNDEGNISYRNQETVPPPETSVLDEAPPPQQPDLFGTTPPEAAITDRSTTPPQAAMEAATSTPPEAAVDAGPQMDMFASTNQDLPLFSGTAISAVEQVFAPRTEIQQESFFETRPEFGQRLEENLIKIKAGDEDLSPTPPAPVTRERTLLDALYQKLQRGEWFDKSRDFEGYIRNLGYDIDSETDLNLAYDLMEGAYNLRARQIRAELDARNAPLIDRLKAMDALESNLTEARRTLGKMKLQQFSTPLTISEAAGHVADVQPGDIVGEPTAGTANLVDRFHNTKNVEVRVNELDPNRQEVLRQIGYEPTGLNLMTSEWVIEDGKKAGAWATVQISNPPWGSYSTGKYGKAMNVPVKLNDWSQRFTYLEMQRLADGGRFVGVMPANWLYSMDRATRAITNKPSEFYAWLKKNYSVQAVIESPPGAYKQRATDISSLLVVIDKTPRLLDNVEVIERYGDTQPKTWDEYSEIVNSVPKRTQEAVTHAQETIKPRKAGPDESGIVDPAARRGETRSDVDAIGKPAKDPTPAKRTRTRGTTRPGSEPDAALPQDGDAVDASQPTREGPDLSPDLVEENAPGVSGPDKPFSYSDAFLERIAAGRAAVQSSGSFAEYVGRAPLGPDDVIHPHPNTVVETKGLSGVPYPDLEVDYRPSPAVMRAMKNRALSYDGNIDPVWAAIQQNDKNGMGMLIADDVGMGKSRSAAAFVIDRIEKGKKKILVVTKDQQNVLNLMNSEFPQVWGGMADENGAFLNAAPTDFPAKRVFLSGENFPKVKKNEEAIPTFEEPTVYFVTSTEFMHFTEQFKQLQPDVVVVDEAHLFKNVGSTARGMSWIQLHKDWISRKVNMLYLTATPGVDLADLRYLYGLKVWAMDGFDDWVKLITGQESPEQVKQKQVARENVDSWLEKVNKARDEIQVENDLTTDGYDSLRLGEIEVYKTGERWNNGRYSYKYKGSGNNTFAAKTETEAIIMADLVNKKLATLPEGVEVSRYDLSQMFSDAEDAFIDIYNPPNRETVKAVGMKDASDILENSEKGKWGKKGLGAFEVTLPPAHTEQIMRELKVAGSYMARDISRAGVEFGVKEYTPPAAAKRSFNNRVGIYRRIYDAWAKFGAMNEGPKKMAAMFGVNGDIQADAKRALFNMRLPGVIAEADAALANGQKVVISVVSVGEVDGETGSLVSAINKINTHKVEKIGKDDFSDPMDIPEAMVEIADLKADLQALEALPSPVDVLRDKYGDRVAFVTGATSTKDRIAAQQNFQRGKLDVIVISGAGKTGINLHDINAKKRVHLIVGDYEWSATNFKQELGRVDRTGQRSSPMVSVMHTGSAAERKFVATISNRMKGLGATSKGGSESTGTGALTENFELGNTMDKIALNAAWQDFPQEWKSAFLDKYFKDPQVRDISRATLDTTSEALSKFLLGLQSIDLDTANQIMESYLEKRRTIMESGSEADDSAAQKTAANTGEILRQVDLGDNLRLSEVRNTEGQKFAVLDGVLTPHMNRLKNAIATDAERYLGGGNGWMRWVQFYDPAKNAYVTGLRVNAGKISVLADQFGKLLSSAHRPETAMVDLKAGDRIRIMGSNASEWELYYGKAGARSDKIIIDGARMKDRDALMKNGAQYNSIGNFFYVLEADLERFFNRFPINNDEQTPTLYQDNPILPEAKPELPMGSFEEAASFLPESEVRDEGFSQHVRPLLEAMQGVAQKRLRSKSLDGTRDMSPEGQEMLRQYMNKVQGEMATTKLATVRWGESQRDHAQFNYNRRTGFDKGLELGYPYQLYYTRAMLRWLAQAVDKPAWFSNYARIYKQQNRYERDMPERLRGKMKIPAPWLPDWAGDSLYIDPIGQLFPPANFLRPLERMQQEQNYQTIETQRILQEWAESGTVTQDEILQAAQTKTGPVWERAVAEAQMRRESEINSPIDFFNTMMGPAWWLKTPLELAGIKTPISKGDPNKVSTLPITNTARALETVTKGTWAEPAGQLFGLLGKPEEWVREKMGLPTLGEYGEYYIKRQIANMVKDGIIDSEQAQMAMIEKKGDIWTQATERVKLELALRVPLAGTTYALTHEGVGAAAQAALPSLFGSGLLPQGELEYRGLKDEWSQAWKLYDSGDKQAVNRFFEKHPEYQAYLAKGKSDEELLKTFLIGQIWDGYMALGDTDKKSARAQMGEQFTQAFLDKETRSYDTLDIETLTQWARTFGKNVPTTAATQPALDLPAQQLNLYPENVSKVTDKFFQDRTRFYPEYYELEQKYYQQPKSGRTRFLLENPQLQAYWDWRDDWYKKFPAYVPILKGKTFKTVDTSSWPPGLVDYVEVYAMTGDRLPAGAMAALTHIWMMEGQPYGDVKAWLNSEVAPAMQYQQQPAP